MPAAAPLLRLEQPGWVAEGSLARTIWRRHAWADTVGRAYVAAGLSSGFAALHARNTQFVARTLGLSEVSDTSEAVRLTVVLGRRVRAAHSTPRGAADRTPLRPPLEPHLLAMLDARPDEHGLEVSDDAPTPVYLNAPTGASQVQAPKPAASRPKTSGSAAGASGPTGSGSVPLVTRAESLAESAGASHAIAASQLGVNVVAPPPPHVGVANAVHAVHLARVSRDDESAVTPAPAVALALSPSEPHAAPHSDARVTPSTANVQAPQAPAVDLQRWLDPDIGPSPAAKPPQPSGATVAVPATANAALTAAARPQRHRAPHEVAPRADASVATMVDAKSLPRDGSFDLARRSDVDSPLATAELRANAPVTPLPEHAMPDVPRAGLDSQPVLAMNIEPKLPVLTVARAAVAREAMDAFASSAAPSAAPPESGGPLTSAAPQPTVLEAHVGAEQQVIGSFDVAVSSTAGTSTHAGASLAQVPAIAAPPDADTPPLAEPARVAASLADAPEPPVIRRAPASVDVSRSAKVEPRFIAQPIEAAAGDRPLLLPPAVYASAPLTLPTQPPNARASPHAMRSVFAGKPSVEASTIAATQPLSGAAAPISTALEPLASLSLPPPLPHEGNSGHAVGAAPASEPVITATVRVPTPQSSTGASLMQAAVKRGAIPNLGGRALSVAMSASTRSLLAGSPLRGAVMQPGPSNEAVSAADVQADLHTSRPSDASWVSSTHTARAATVLSRAVGNNVTPTFAPHTDAFPIAVAGRRAGSTSPSLTPGAGTDGVWPRPTPLPGLGFAAPPVSGLASSGAELAASSLSLPRSTDSLPAPAERFEAESQPAAAHAGGVATSTHNGAAVDLDELVERTLQALMLRLDIERERRGFNRWA